MIARWRWWIWGGVMGGWFAYLETQAIRNGLRGDTLSEYVYTTPLPVWVGVLGGLVWLLWHFITGRLRTRRSKE